MKILPLNIYPHIKNNGQNSLCFLSANFSPNLAPLKQDTIFFKGSQHAAKKSDFKGLDFATVEKYRVDISKFKSTDDLQYWANDKIKTITDKDYGGRQEETKVQRKALLKEWSEYVTKENDAYTPVMQLAILDAITKDLKNNTDTIPPSLNKGVLADTMSEVIERLNKNPKENVNINKLYQTKLSAASAPTDEDGKLQTDYTGWIVIPSQNNDPANFDENVDKLKALSHDSWCTKSFNAEPYLSIGDFHVYLENGKPKLGVRFIDDKIQEIQGELNNGQIPQEHLHVVENHIIDINNKIPKELSFLYIKLLKSGLSFPTSVLSTNAKTQLKNAEKAKKQILEFRKKIGINAIKNYDVEKILPHFGISVIKDEKDGKYIISNYKKANKKFSYKDLGIDENKLFKKIKKIDGDASFECTDVTNLGALVEIGGNACFIESKVTKLGNLKTIQGDANFRFSDIVKLDNLAYIGKNANFKNSKIPSLENLRYVGQCLHLSGSQVTDFGQLERVDGDIYLEESKVKSLGHLKNIGGNAYFSTSEVEDLGELESIDGKADFDITKIKNWGKLRKIGDSVDLWIDTNEKFNGCRVIEKIKDPRFDKAKEIFKNITVIGNVCCPYYTEYNK